MSDFTSVNDMMLLSSIGISLRGLNSHRLRGFLSILGVIIGVVAVIGMGALAASMQNAIEKQASQMGANTFTVERVSPIEMGLQWTSGNRQAVFELFRRPRFDIDYIGKIKESCPSVRSVAPVTTDTRRVRFGRVRTDQSMRVVATNEDFLQGGIYEIEEGRFFLPHEVKTRNAVCVIGQDLVEEFFNNQDPLGKEISVGPVSCKVIGTLKKIGSTLGQNPDRVAIIPITLGIKNWPWMRWSMSISIEAFPGKIEDAQDEVITAMRRIRGLRPEDNNNFSIITSEMMKSLFNKITGVAALVVLLIAGVSLIVAGIGIMNVMFVAVKERTKEIGIRKACGAPSSSILIQFASEAILLSTIGGVLGMIVIAGLVALFDNLLPFELIFPVWLIILGLAFSFAVGVVFGIIPAYQASRLNVVDALRYE